MFSTRRLLRAWPLLLASAGAIWAQDARGPAAARQLCQKRAPDKAPAVPEGNFKSWPGKLIQFLPDGFGHVTIAVGLCPDGQGGFSLLLQNPTDAPVMLNSPLVKSMQTLSLDDLVEVDGAILGNTGVQIPGAARWAIPTQFVRIQSAADVATPEKPAKSYDDAPAGKPSVPTPPPAADGVVQPVLIRKVEPKYTARARALGINCGVELDMVVNASGKAENIRVTKPCETALGNRTGAASSGSSEARIKQLKSQREQALTEAALFRKRAADVTDPEDRARMLRRAQQLESEANDLQASIAAAQKQAETDKGKRTTTANENLVRMQDAAKDLDDNAVIAVMQYEFKPGTRNGQPVSIRASLTVEFSMGR